MYNMKGFDCYEDLDNTHDNKYTHTLTKGQSYKITNGPTHT